MKTNKEGNALTKNAIRVTDQKTEQVSGGCEPVGLPDGVVITDICECRKCGYTSPTGKPLRICPICGGSDWEIC